MRRAICAHSRALYARPLSIQCRAFGTRRGWVRRPDRDLQEGPGYDRVGFSWPGARGREEQQQYDDYEDRRYQIPAGGSRRVLWTLLGMNVGVYLLWKAAEGSPRRMDFMMDHFTVSNRNLSEGRLHTLVTSAFSQESFMHLLMNAFVIYSLGSSVLASLGSRRFVALYLTCAVGSSLSHVAWQRSKRVETMQHRFGGTPVYGMRHVEQQRQWDVPALGASGSAMGIVAMFASLFPRQQLTLFVPIFEIIPIPVSLPAWAVAALLIGGDAALAYYQSTTGRRTDNVAHTAHIGGALVGFAYYVLLRGRGKLLV